jgi:hypothetical protein
MDFAINGSFKWALFEKQANSLPGLERVMKSVRLGLSREVLDGSLKSCGKQVRLIIEGRGLFRSSIT